MLTAADRATKLDRHRPLPLYEQLKGAINALIDTSTWKAGDRLPSTDELCRRFGVSHITITRALRDLEQDGVVTRIQGKGTFVTGRRIERRLTSLISFTSEMARQGLKVRSQILGVEEFRGTIQHNLAFRRSPNSSEAYIQIRRLRLIEDTPVCLATSVFPEAVGRRLLQFPLGNASFYQLMEERLGLRLLREERWLTPTVAGKPVAKLLSVRRGAALIQLDGMTYLEGDIPVEATHSLFRGDKFRFFANMYRFIGDNAQREAEGFVLPLNPYPAGREAEQ